MSQSSPTGRWRGLSLLLCAQTASIIGDQSLYVAQIFWGKSLTQTAHAASILLAMNSIPRVFFGPVAGVVADTFSRKKIIVLCDVLSALCLAFCTWIIFDESIALTARIIAFCFASLSVATASTFFLPAVSALIPGIVAATDLGRANSLKQGLRDSAAIAGQSISGLLFGSLGTAGMMLLDSASFAVSAGFCAGIKEPVKAHTSNADVEGVYKAFWTKLKLGFRQVWKKNDLRNVAMTIVSINVAFAPFPLLLPFILQRLGLDEASWFGFLMGAFAAGNVVGAFSYSKVLALYSGRRNRFLVFLLTLWIPLILLGWMPHPLLCCILLFICGTFTGHINVRIASRIQEVVRTDALGRVFSVFGTVSALVTPVTLLSVGALPSSVAVGYPHMVQSMLGLFGLMAMAIIGRRFSTFMANSDRNTSL